MISNQHWGIPDVLKAVDETPRTAEAIREIMNISPYDKRGIYYLDQTLQKLANDGVIHRDKDSQTYRRYPKS